MTGGDTKVRQDLNNSLYILNYAGYGRKRLRTSAAFQAEYTAIVLLGYTQDASPARNPDNPDIDFESIPKTCRWKQLDNYQRLNDVSIFFIIFKIFFLNF